jgi:hypothetical protein
MSTLSPPVLQQPSTLWVPDRLGTYGDEINGWADSLKGLLRDDVQKRDIDCLASFGPQGRWLTLETAILEGRQNGKSKAVLMAIALADFFLGIGGPDDVFWTSHRLITTLEMFTFVKTLIEANPTLSRKVRTIVEQRTQEGVILTNGARLWFVARQGGNIRGLGGKRTVFDEELFLAMSSLGDILPASSARDSPQVMYGSSAGKRESIHQQGLRRRGLRQDPSLVFIEYKAPGSWKEPGCARGLKCSHIYDDPAGAGCVFDDPRTAYHANHAMGVGRMREEFVLAERRALCINLDGVLEYGRERAGWPEADDQVIDPDAIQAVDWENQTDPQSSVESTGPIAVAIDMPPSGEWVSVSVAGLREDGTIHFGTIRDRMRPGDVPKYLASLDAPVGADTGDPRFPGLGHDLMCPILWTPTATVGGLRAKLEEEGVGMEDVSELEYSESCGALKMHISAGTAWHRGTTVLNDAFRASVRRVRPEGGWIFGRLKSAGDISPLVSSTLAVRGADKYGERNPGVWSL